MKNTIVLIGKKNVGKSTLFNFLTKKKDAIVDKFSGLTKDRKYGKLKFKKKIFIIIDTGGINKKKNEIEKKIYYQTKLAIQESEIIFFIINIRNGILQSDKNIVKKLHKYKKKIYIILNKIDNLNIKYIIHDFYTFGVKDIYPISALHGIGVKKLIYDIYLKNKNFKKNYQIKTKKNINKNIKIIITGKPNVGKSTLINKITQQERLIVSKQPGTTIDDIHVTHYKNNFKYTFVDTSGIIQDKKNTNQLNKVIIKKTFNLIKKSDVVLFILDIEKKISKKEIILINKILKIAKFIIIVFNKIDKIKKKNHLLKIKKKITKKLNFFYFIEIKFISALKNINIDELFSSIEKNYQLKKTKIKTSLLTNIARKIEKKLKTSIFLKKKIKIKYAHVLNYTPVIFLIHGSNVTNLPNFYQRFLIKTFYKKLKIKGKKIYLTFKNTKNPYKKKKKFYKIKK